MRHIFTTAVAACIAFGAVAAVQQPALPAVRHLRVNHSPAPSRGTFKISRSSPGARAVTSPPAGSNAVCSSCPPPNTSPCGACPPQPAYMQLNLVQLPL